MSLPERARAVHLIGPEKVELRTAPVPRPGPGEILLKVEAATTCGTDVKVFRRGGHPRMLKVPSPFGHEMSGTVAAVGPGEARFREGERVVVANSAPCGDCAWCSEGRENLCADLRYLNGAFSEYLLVPERFVRWNTLRLPGGMPFETAALTEPLACVLHGIETCGFTGATDVAIYGAGPIGLLFTAALKGGALTAEEHPVTLADPNPERLQTGHLLGADETVSIERGGGQAARVLARAVMKDGFDAAIDCTGTPEGWADAIASVSPGGVVCLFGGCPPGTTVPLDAGLVHYSEITIKSPYHHRPSTVRKALELLARETFDARLLLTAERPLEQVEEALRSMMRKEALKVVIRPGN